MMESVHILMRDLLIPFLISALVLSACGRAGIVYGEEKLPKEIILVTVSEDEDDTGGTPTLEAAGGVGDISLREALLIAASVATPHVIRFDPELFLETSSRTILLDPALGGLPPVVLDGSGLDGQGAGVIIDGVDLTTGVGLRILASNVYVGGLVIQGFIGDEDSACFRHERGDRLELEGCAFVGCGSSSGYAVDIERGAGHQITDCQISGAVNTAMRLAPFTAGATLRQLAISSANFGLLLQGRDHLAVELKITTTRSSLACDALERATVRDCSMVVVDNSAHNSTIAVRGSSRDLLIEGGSYSSRDTHTLYVSGTSTAVEIRRSDMKPRHSLSPILIVEGSNSGIRPPVIEDFDGVRVSGSSTAEGGVVELYAPEETWTFLAEGQVVDGHWLVTLPESKLEVAAKVTSAEGSTSEFSPRAQRS